MNNNVHRTLKQTSKNITGPVMFDFVSWILTEAVKRNIKTLYFLARDGYTLHQMALLIVKKFHLPITCKYLYCSRHSLRLPTYHFIGEEAYDLLFLGGYDVTVDSLLERGSVPDAAKKKIYQELQIKEADCVKPLLKFEINEIAAQLKKNHTYNEIICEASRNAYPEIIGYLEQEGLFDQEQVAIVDSGWTGSIQRSLRQLLQSAGFIGTIIGFYFGMYASPKSQMDGTYLTWYFNKEGRTLDKALFCNNLFECILSAPHGMTLAYQEQGGIYMPVLSSPPKKSELHLIQAQIEEILDYTKCALTKVSPRFDKEIALKNTKKLLHRFMAWPTEDEAVAYGQFMFDDDVKDKNQRVLANKEQLILLQEYVIPVRVFRRIKRSCENIPELFWVYGTVALSPQKRWWYWCNVFVWEWLKYKVY